LGKKTVIAVLVIIAVAIYLTIREEGGDHAFGGALAPLESVRGEGIRAEVRAEVSDAPPAGGGAMAPPQSDYGAMVGRVRGRVEDAMDRSVARSSR
jgi:hypothetical protein